MRATRGENDLRIRTAGIGMEMEDDTDSRASDVVPNRPQSVENLPISLSRRYVGKQRTATRRGCLVSSRLTAGQQQLLTCREHCS